MKINEAHLLQCTEWSDSNPVKSGYLYKKSETHKLFHKRWFQLKDNLLFYFSRSKSDPIPLGLIILEGCCVERIDDLTFQLTFPGSGARDYVLSAKTKEDVDEWMDVITSAGFDYMLYAIKELEVQAEELRQERLQDDLDPDTDSSSSCTLSPGDRSDIWRPGSSSSATETLMTNTEETERRHSSFEGHSQQNKTLRIFEEMHSKFGLYIQSKTDKTTQENTAPS